MNNDASHPLVSTIVVSFHGGNMLTACLLSLEKQDYPNHEIVVVDNGSGKHLEDALSSKFKKCRWITENRNLGFAGGCNRGIAEARGSLLAFINDDANADPSWLSSMVECMQTRPDTGAVAGLVIDGNNPAILDSFGVGVALDGMSRQLECGQSSSEQRTSREVLAFSGCSCMVRARALESTGCFDERFFAYCEDTDLSLRIIKAGWKIITCPAAKSIHYYSRTGGRYSLKKMYLIERNHYWVGIKTFPLPLLLLLPFTNIIRTAIQAYACLTGKGPVRGFIGNGPFRVTLTLCMANISALIHTPIILIERILQARKQTASSRGFQTLLLSKRMRISEVILSGAPAPRQR